MKANQKFLQSRDDGVSPVIAVILMVAITVVLAATVYVWVSGFGSSSTEAQQSISLTSKKTGSMIEYSVASAGAGLRWSDLKFQVAGISGNFEIVTSVGDASGRGTTTTYTPASDSTVSAGARFWLVNGETTDISSVELMVLDLGANSIMAKVVGGKADAASAATTPTITSANRMSGTAGTFNAGVTQFTLSQPIDMNTLALADLSLDNAHVLGDSTITVRSPTQFEINWGGTGDAAVGDTLTLALGGVNTAAGAATTAAATIVLLAAM